MVYAVTADLNSLIAKFPVGTATTPTATQADLILGYISGEIDSILSSLGFTVPVTAPASFVSYLKLLNAEGAAALVLWSMFPADVGPAEASSGGSLWRAYQIGLKRLQGGEGIPDGVATSSAILMETYLSANPEEELDIGDLAEPIFPIDKVF